MMKLWKNIREVIRLYQKIERVPSVELAGLWYELENLCEKHGYSKLNSKEDINTCDDKENFSLYFNWSFEPHHEEHDFVDGAISFDRVIDLDKDDILQSYRNITIVSDSESWLRNMYNGIKEVLNEN